MNATRARPASAPALLVALSMAVCLGAAVDAGANAQTRVARPATFTAAEREALASLLACLSDTRQARRAEQSPAARLGLHNPPRHLADAPLARQPHRLTADADPLGPGTLTHAHLLNLPPPR